MKIFVGNLSSQVTEEQLKHLFEEYGPVKGAKIISDNYTNRSRGFGFVEMESNSDGERAIDKLNNTSFQQQSIVVNEARPRNEEHKPFNKRY